MFKTMCYPKECGLESRQRRMRPLAHLGFEYWNLFVICFLELEIYGS
jgi:hypothetical protein